MHEKLHTLVTYLNETLQQSVAQPASVISTLSDYLDQLVDVLPSLSHPIAAVDVMTELDVFINRSLHLEPLETILRQLRFLIQLTCLLNFDHEQQVVTMRDLFKKSAFSASRARSIKDFFHRVDCCWHYAKCFNQTAQSVWELDLQYRYDHGSTLFNKLKPKPFVNIKNNEFLVITSPDSLENFIILLDMTIRQLLGRCNYLMIEPHDNELMVVAAPLNLRQQKPIVRNNLLKEVRYVNFTTMEATIAQVKRNLSQMHATLLTLPPIVFDLHDSSSARAALGTSKKIYINLATADKKYFTLELLRRLLSNSANENTFAIQVAQANSSSIYYEVNNSECVQLMHARTVQLNINLRWLLNAERQSSYHCLLKHMLEYIIVLVCSRYGFNIQIWQQPAGQHLQAKLTVAVPRLPKADRAAKEFLGYRKRAMLERPSRAEGWVLDYQIRAQSKFDSAASFFKPRKRYLDEPLVESAAKQPCYGFTSD